MQNTDEVIQQGLVFLQTGMGLAMVTVVALMALVCVLLTVLVVSLGATQRTLVARADSANRALLQIRESLANSEQAPPIRRRPVINEPNLPLSRVAGRAPEAPKIRETAKPAARPARSARNDGRTDVYVSADVRDPGIQPARKSARAEARVDAHSKTDADAAAKRKARAGASTDVFKSVDI